MLRRFVPLLVCLALAILVMLSRLWDVQIVQHEVWAREAANLVRSYGVDPFVRGAIRDRNGDLIVRDEERYELQFVWRDFRRGHPLGQIAMMRSLAKARPVGLDEARYDLVETAFGYAGTSPAELEAFARGGELDVVVDYVPAIAAESKSERLKLARKERRRSRAGDIRFYVLRLLDLKPRDLKSLEEKIDSDKAGKKLSYLELAAWATDQSLKEVVDTLRERVIQADMQLTRLAGLIEWGDRDRARRGDEVSNLLAVASPGDRLVALIEEQRHAVDNDTADALFHIASGFSPTRLDEDNLALLDLEWLRIELDWDATRLREWRASRGTAYAREVAAWGAGFAVARSKPRREAAEVRSRVEPLAEAVGGAADRVISACAHAFRAEADANERIRKFGEPEDWRLVERIAVLDALARNLDGGPHIPGNAQVGVFPFQDSELPMAAYRPEELLERVFSRALARHARALAELDPVVRTTPARLAEQLHRVANDRRRDWKRDDEALFAALLLDMHERLQRRVNDVLSQIAAEDDGGVAFDNPSIERAQDRRRYVVRDRGARSKRIGEEPRIDLVLLVTRYRDAFAGFRVTSTTRRVPIALGPDGEHSIASQLIGSVRSPFLVDVLRQQPQVEELIALQRKLSLPEADRRRILTLIDGIHQPGSTIGGSGLEAWFDDELSGNAGYREVHGLQDRIAGNRMPIYNGAVDGVDVTLTLDIALQRAAEDVLSNPAPPDSGDRKVDDEWFQSPIGAIVLATVDGEILVAASVPIVPGSEADPLHPRHDSFLMTDGERAIVSERALTRRKFQPPGSVVKPLLAAYALEHLGLDAAAGLVHCDKDRPRPGTSPKKDWRAGFGQINCHSSAGHSQAIAGKKMDLRGSLKHSCNVYFAALAERLYDGESIRAAYHLFGFGVPTGVRYDDRGQRSGLVDSFRAIPNTPLDDAVDPATTDEVDRQFLGNGLQLVSGSAVQVARAYAGLASGELPEMTLVKSIAGKEIPRRSRSLGIERKHLDFVHDALDRVVNERGGSANNKGLGEDDLGFRIAAKTGSADYKEGWGPPNEGRGSPVSEFLPDKMRKHTWFASWFPSDEPEYVLVVYLHDTSTTASHSAVYIAGQFLSRPEVKELMGLLGSGGKPVEAGAKTTGEGR